MLIKGLKGSALVTPEIQSWVNDNTGLLLVGSFVFFTMLMQLLHWLKVNVLRVIVLIGTFSLAMAFAGNDLVNFIGVFMAGFDSYKIASATGDTAMLMGDLTKPVHANLYILLA